MLISFATEAIMFVETLIWPASAPRSTSSNAYNFHGVVDLLVGCLLLCVLCCSLPCLNGRLPVTTPTVVLQSKLLAKDLTDNAHGRTPLV